MEKPSLPPKQWLTRIDHVLEAIADIEAHIEHIDEAAFVGDRMRHQSVLWCLQIIGEAIQGLPEDFRERYPDVEWRAIRSMRNTIVHQYHRVEFDTVWRSIQTGLPELKKQMIDIRNQVQQGHGESDHP